MSRAEDNTGTTAVREAHRVDEARLSAWLIDNIEGFVGPVKLEQFKGGQSNPTYKVITPTQIYVLRRKPPGLLLKGAHAIEREARIMQALQATRFPTPRVFGMCWDEAVIGSWFFLMEYVEGRIFWDVTLPNVSHEERPLYFDAMNDTLARLHCVDYADAGLSDFGRPGNYFERQIQRWSKQYYEDADGGRDPNMDRLVELLPVNIPSGDQSSIVHGDFRCDNMIFHPIEPRVIAVLDWELSTLGHSGADFAYHAMMYRMPPHIVAGLAGEDLDALHIPSEEEYLAAYCRRMGHESMPDYDFYIAFNFFRLAAIFHGIKGRVVRGTAASAQAAARARHFPELAHLAMIQAERALHRG